MAWPTTFLLAVIACLLGANLPPAASRPALLKPEGSYPPVQESFIKIVDEFLNQLLNQVVNTHKEDGGSFNKEDDLHDAENSLEAEMRPLLPRPTSVPSMKPSRPGDSGGVGSYGGSETYPGTQQVNDGHIVFPSN